MADARTPPFKLHLGRFIVYAVLLFAVCFYGIPLLWLLLAGTRSQSSLFADPPFMIGTWDSFIATWNLAGRSLLSTAVGVSSLGGSSPRNAGAYADARPVMCPRTPATLNDAQGVGPSSCSAAIPAPTCFSIGMIIASCSLPSM